MATFLYRLGRLAFRWKWAVALLWAALLGGVGTASALAPAAPDQTFSMPGTESQKAADQLKERFPGTDSEAAYARIVFVAKDGQQVTAADSRTAITEAVRQVAAGPQVTAAVDPFQGRAVSKDGRTAYAAISYQVPAKKLTGATKQTLRDAAQHARNAGLTVEIGGSALATDPAAGGASEVIGIAIAAVVLLITFASMAAAGLPLLTALIGVGVGVAGILALASALDLSSTTTTLAMMLGLAVGIDYAVLIISRYREERGRGHDPREAVGRAIGTAGSSVVFAGLTVIIGLAGLFVVGVPMLTKMGLSAAATVGVAVLVALTLVPALLGLFPDAVRPRAERKGKAGHAARANGGARWATLVRRRPLLMLLTAGIGLIVIAIPVTHLHLGSSGDEAKPTSTTERRAYDDLAGAFGPGFNGPLTIVVDARAAKSPKIAIARVAEKIAASPGVVSVSRARYDSAGSTAVFSAIPSTGPVDTQTADLVHALRAERPAIAGATGATFTITGLTAVNIDSAQKVQDSLIPYLALVVGLAFVLLMIVFRSVLVPLKAAAGFLLSVLAALGAVVAVFQWGWLAGLLGVSQTGPIMSLMPIFLVGIVFGLAMDYEVFLVSRVREAYVHGESPGDAITSGLRNSARVVVAAALIMIAVFSGFIGAGESMIKMIGFGLAIAVLFDAFVVRMTIIPAALALLGRAAWWMPRRLDRALPKVDVEGEALNRPAPVPAEPVAAGRR